MSSSHIHTLIQASFTSKMKSENPEIIHLEITPDQRIIYIVESGIERRRQQICVEGWYTRQHDKILIDAASDRTTGCTIGRIDQRGTHWDPTYLAQDGDSIAFWRSGQRISCGVKRVLRIHALDCEEPRFTAERMEDGKQAIFCGHRQVSKAGIRIRDVLFAGDEPHYRVETEEGSNKSFAFSGMTPKFDSTVSYKDHVAVAAQA